MGVEMTVRCCVVCGETFADSRTNSGTGIVSSKDRLEYHAAKVHGVKYQRKLPPCDVEEIEQGTMFDRDRYLRDAY
jgi:hypothetical protein